VHDGARLLGSYSGVEPSLRETDRLVTGGSCPRFEYREVVLNHEAGASNPYDARSRGKLREACQPHERSAVNSDRKPQLETLPKL